MAASAAATASDPAQLKSAREDIKELLKTTHCHPILVRTVIRVHDLRCSVLFAACHCLHRAALRQ
jgi:hypothetical protein